MKYLIQQKWMSFWKIQRAKQRVSEAYLLETSQKQPDRCFYTACLIGSGTNLDI